MVSVDLRNWTLILCVVKVSNASRALLVQTEYFARQEGAILEHDHYVQAEISLADQTGSQV